MEIGKVIKCERTKRNLSQNELAELLKISRQSISKWETGLSLPNTEQLINISKILDLSLDSLLKGDSVMENKVIKDSKNKFLWWEDDIARPFMLILWGGIVPLLFILKYVIHIF